MTIPFEPTRSYVYKAARYELLPRIAEIARDFGDEPFLLREISKRLLAETYTPEQLEIRIKKAQSDRTEKMSAIFGVLHPISCREPSGFRKPRRWEVQEHIDRRGTGRSGRRRHRCRIGRFGHHLRVFLPLHTEE